jgi:low density lipoprotein receptor-related protein 5/6
VSADAPRIERAYLDGTGRRVLVRRDLQWPNGLVVDYEDNVLFWADAHLNRIELCDFRGRNRRVVVNSIATPYGLALVSKTNKRTMFNLLVV